MALVFKIKFRDMLHRWLVSEDFNAMAFSLTFSQLEDKIRDLFRFSHTASLVLTYVDKDNDVVTIGDDQDLVDACLIQKLNPLRLEVHEKACLQDPSTESFMSFIEDGNMEAVLKVSHPYTTAAEHQSSVEASTLDILHSKDCTGLLLQKPKTLAGGDSSDGLKCVLSHVPVLPNHRTDNLHYVFHRGVKCDGCGMNPIEGPRYKSKKVPDHDLCFSCFDMMGTAADFEKLDRPETSPTHSHGLFRFFKKCSMPTLAPTLRASYVPECPFTGQALEIFSPNEFYRRLDARFVEDVTVLDGTELEPGTRFTKTWRIENNGTLPWPKGTQLAHIGGTALRSMDVVKLELPEGGLPCGQDVEISLDLEAPNVVGRHVSYWRLLSPLGQWFGHTVWVVIQVRSQPEKFNNNVNQYKKAEDISMDKERLSTTGMPKTDVHSSVVLSEEVPETGGVNSFVILSEEVQNPRVLDTETDIELDGFAFVEKPVESDQVVSMQKGIAETELDTQIKLLETLGFGDQESNSFWLKKNNADIQNTLKDLLVCADWEDQIRNLEEMGFNDQKTNICLLHKHEGSIKLVVNDLVKMENQAKGKESQ